jgi:hypothetical protein
MKRFEEMQVYMHIFSTSAPDGGEYQMIATDAFLLENIPQYPLDRRLGAACLDAVEKSKFSYTYFKLFTLNTRIKQVSLKIRTYSPVRIAASC